MDLGIHGKWALVCAASKGLGKGCAQALVREGVNVVITARGNDALQATASELRALAPGAFVGGMPAFPVALVANNLACLGRAAEGIRYLWPEKVTGPSRNFWIRWKPSKGFVVERRVSASPSNPVLAEQAFDEDSVEHMIKCLVTGARIKPASLLPGKILFIWSRR